MNIPASYELQRQSLRLRLQANRLMLPQSTYVQLPVSDDEYPRSRTMRFLSGNPGIVTFLVSDLAPFLLGRYLAKQKRGKRKSK